MREKKTSHRIASSGFYAFAEVDKKVEALQKEGKKVIDFGVGDPKAATPDFVIEALAKGAKKYATYGYPSYIGDASFRQAASEYLKREYNISCSPETEITATIGSKEAVFHFPLAFVDEGDIVICPTPGYPPYKKGTEYAGGQPYFVPLTEKNDFLINLDDIPEDVAKKAKIIWVCSPNSPTGKISPREWLKKLLSWAKKYDVLIAADDGCYHEIYFEEKPTNILEIEKEGVVVFFSLSKTFNMTGYRVGFLAGDEQIISAFRKIKTQIDSGCPTFVQEAASVALRNKEFPEKIRKEYFEKRNILLDAFDAIGLPKSKSEGTFYLWQESPRGMSGKDFAMKLIEQGIVVTPGEWISDITPDGCNPGKEFVRLALVATKEECKEAAERIKKHFSL
jgi:LL-diaminopimelate aminotransferase